MDVNEKIPEWLGGPPDPVATATARLKAFQVKLVALSAEAREVARLMSDADVSDFADTVDRLREAERLVAKEIRWVEVERGPFIESLREPIKDCLSEMLHGESR